MEITREQLEQYIGEAQQSVQKLHGQLAQATEAVKTIELNIAANQGAIQGYRMLLGQDGDEPE